MLLAVIVRPDVGGTTLEAIKVKKSVNWRIRTPVRRQSVLSDNRINKGNTLY